MTDRISQLLETRDREYFRSENLFARQRVFLQDAFKHRRLDIETPLALSMWLPAPSAKRSTFAPRRFDVAECAVFICFSLTIIVSKAV